MQTSLTGTDLLPRRCRPLVGNERTLCCHKRSALVLSLLALAACSSPDDGAEDRLFISSAVKTIEVSITATCGDGVRDSEILELTAGNDAIIRSSRAEYRVFFFGSSDSPEGDFRRTIIQVFREEKQDVIWWDTASDGSLNLTAGGFAVDPDGVTNRVALTSSGPHLVFPHGLAGQVPELPWADYIQNTDLILRSRSISEHAIALEVTERTGC